MRRPLLAAFALFVLFPVLTVAQSASDDADDQVLIRINGPDSINADETVGVVAIINDNLEISGAVTEVAVVVSGDLTVLNGADIEGDLVVIDGALTLRDGSRVSGNVYLSNDSEWIVESGAVFTGEVEQGNFTSGFDDDFAWQVVIIALASWFGTTLVAIAIATIFAGIGGRQLWTSAAYLSSRPGATALATIAFWIVLMLLVVPIILSLVALVALPLFVMIAVAVWTLGYITFGTRIGASITGQRTSDPQMNHPYLASIAGVVVLQLVALLALSCFLAAGLIAWFGNENSGVSAVFGIPGAIFYVILILAGLIGGGALVLRAVAAWSSDN